MDADRRARCIDVRLEMAAFLCYARHGIPRARWPRHAIVEYDRWCRQRLGDTVDAMLADPIAHHLTGEIKSMR